MTLAFDLKTMIPTIKVLRKENTLVISLPMLRKTERTRISRF